jgi:hypothetical protein
MRCYAKHVAAAAAAGVGLNMVPFPALHSAVLRLAISSWFAFSRVWHSLGCRKMATDDHTHARGSQSSGASSPNSTTAMLPSRISDARKDAAVLIEDSSSIDVELDQQSGWHSQRATLSLPEAHATIKMPAQASASPWRMMLAFAGCGTIISVGYM